LLEADRPPAPLELRRALATISAITEGYIKMPGSAQLHKTVTKTNK
jgi:hypothetical protein